MQSALLIFFGVILSIAPFIVFWAALPAQGVKHRLLRNEAIEEFFPILLMGIVVCGVACIVQGIT